VLQRSIFRKVEADAHVVVLTMRILELHDCDESAAGDAVLADADFAEMPAERMVRSERRRRPGSALGLLVSDHQVPCQG
jgi:hypothetical protein